MTTSDQESAAGLRKKRNIKCAVYIVVGIILQCIIIAVFAVTILKIRNPKVRLGGVTVESLQLNTSSSSPSFSMKLNAQVTVKNTNFGHYKFENTTATISYKGTPVGEATIIKARAKARSTKKLNVTMSVTSDKVSTKSQLHTDINSGVITLSSHAKLSGKVHLFKIMKKKKSVEMNCTMDVNTATKVVQNLKCK